MHLQIYRNVHQMENINPIHLYHYNKPRKYIYIYTHIYKEGTTTISPYRFQSKDEHAGINWSIS